MSEIQKATQPAAAKIKVKLKQKHSHAGTEYEPGAEIEVTQAQADWLKAQGVI
jgi:hypothetical protein